MQATHMCVKGSQLGNVCRSHTITQTPWVPPPDFMAVFVCLMWLVVLTSVLRLVRYALMWFLIVGTFRSHDSFHRWGAKFYLASFENGLWKLCTLYLRAPGLVQLIPSLFWLENDEVVRPPRSPTHACHPGYFYTKQRRHGGY